VGVSETAGAVAVPVPVSVTDWGDPAALSVTASVAANAPVANGLKATETVQEAPAASDEVHVVAVLRKSVGLVPATAMLVMASAAVPLFLTVTTCAAVSAPSGVEAKAMLVGVSVTPGAEAETAVPVSVADWEPVPALSVTVNVPVSVPKAIGWKLMVTVQEAPAAKGVVGQFLLAGKEPPSVPPSAKPVKVTAAVPVFLMVITSVVGSVVLITVVPGKVTAVGESVIAGVPVVLGHAFTRLATLSVPSPVV